MIKNQWRVPAQQWREWSEQAQAVFNKVYDFAFNNVMLMNHPKAPPLTPAQVKTLAWNSAWIAADAVDDCLPTIVVDLKKGRVVHEARRSH